MRAAGEALIISTGNALLTTFVENSLCRTTFFAVAEIIGHGSSGTETAGPFKLKDIRPTFFASATTIARSTAFGAGTAGAPSKVETFWAFALTCSGRFCALLVFAQLLLNYLLPFL